MRRIFLSLISVLMLLPLQAKQIGQAAALRQAVAFTRTTSPLKANRADANDFKLAYVESTDKVDNFYVYNDANGGFVIVAADDCVTPILGYSDSESFNAADIPDGLKYMLGEYKKQINTAIANAENGSSNVNTLAITKGTIAPLLTTKWNQGAPYNNLCPMYSTTQRSVTGCTATAMAQIINYHKHPVQGKGSKTYSPTINGTKKTLTVNFGETTYDWDNMLNDYQAVSYTTAQANAVATLMYHCGVGASMQYGPSSGAAVIDAAKAIINYFDFSPSLKYTSRHLYNNADWEDLIYNELANKRPVLYAGYNEEGGHAFVCDGYRRDGYFHINWGWGGSSDGYFKLTLLDPSSQGYGGSSYGYNKGQEILYNITPTKEEGNALEVSTDGGVSCSISSTTASNGSTIIFKTGSYTTFTFFDTDQKNVLRGLLAVNKSTNAETYIFDLDSYTVLSATYSMPNVRVYSQSLAGLGDGEYRLYPAFKDSSSEDKGKILLKAGAAQYIDLTVSGNSLRFNAQSVENPNIKVEISNVPENVYNGASCNFTALVSNTGGEFFGEIYPAILNADNQIVARSNYTSYFLNKGDNITDNVSIPLPKNIAAGEYRLVYFSMDSKVLSDYHTVVVKDNPGEGQPTNVNFTFDSADAVDMNNLEVNVSITALNGLLDGIFAVAIADYENMTIVDQINSDRVIINPDETKTFTIKGSFAGEPNTKYYMAIYYYSNSTYAWNLSSGWKVFTTMQLTGIEDAKCSTELNVYPNPATDIVNISSASPMNQISIFSIEGKMVDSIALDADTAATISVADYPQGIYMLKIVSEDGNETIRLIKK